MDGHEQQELSDTTLEKELEAAVGVEPSPEFLPRIRARVASERIGARWVSFRPWQWAAATAAVGLVAVAGLWTLREPMPPAREALVTNAPSVEASHAAAEAVTSSAGSTPSAVVPAPEADRSNPARAARSTRPPAIAEPEVLISEDEAAALKRLFAAIGERRLETSALPDLASALEPPEPIEDIVLEPISIIPLAPLEGE
jgi:hypothetical protein